MKYLIYLFLAFVAMTSCNPGDRQHKDMTDEKEQNVSPDQTVSPEEQARKDSTSTDLVGEDTAAAKVGR